jgi:hypothetical protein
MEDVKAGDLDAIEELLGGKWFWPILVRLDEFEGKLLEVMPFMGPVLDDDSPDWSFRCIQYVIQKDGDVNGYCDARKMGARDVGRLVSAKFSLCEAMSKSKVQWDSLTPEQVTQVDEFFKEPGFVAECRELTRRFAEELTPEILGIKRASIALAIDAGGMEEVDYLSGYVQGAAFLDRVRSKYKPARTKRQKDAANRLIVLFFAGLIGQVVDESKGELSWPELHQQFLEAFDHKIEIEEETFKKILSRKGLKGVGRAGRPVPEKKFKVKRKRPDSESDEG